MKETFTSAWTRVRQFIDRDPARNPNYDRPLSVLVIGTIVLVVLSGFGLIRYALTPGGQPASEGAIVVDGGGGIANPEAVLVDETLPEFSIPTGEATGGKEEVTEATVALSPDIPLDATRDVAPDVGPASPGVVSPGSGAAVRALAPELKWSKQSGATSYHLELSRSSATDEFGYFLDPVVSMPLLSSTSVRPPAIRENGTYYWHVGVGVKGKYEIRFSPTASIKVSADPVVMGPTGSATIKRSEFAMAWKALSGAASYQVEISKSTSGDAAKGYDEFVLRESYIEATVFTPKNIPRAGTYFWHVRGIDLSNSRGPFGENHKFVLID